MTAIAFKQMMKDEASPDRSPSRRVLAWWDIDVEIGAFHKRKMTARPLKELERALGHRLHVEGWERYEQMPSGVWKFHAYHYLETADPAVAAYTTLNQLQQLSGWLGMSWQGFNTAATPSADPDEAAICAFYWNPPDQIAMPRYVSSGVLLMLQDEKAEAFIRYDRNERRRHLARPHIKPPAPPEQRASYVIEFTVRIVCGNKQDLMTFHWPRFQALHWPEGADLVDVDARTHAGKPNIIRVRETLRDVREHEAIAHCLALAPSFRVRLDRDDTLFRFAGGRYPGREYSDGIAALVMTRI